MEHEFIRTSEAEDVLASLRHAAICIDLAKSDPHAWKWFVISFFAAVQGAIVCHAAGSTQIEVLKEENAKNSLRFLNGQLDFVESNLAYPDTLYNRLKGTNSALPPEGGLIQTDRQQDEAFKRLKSLRDQFLHFVPGRWSIDIDHIRESIAPMIRLIEYIVGREYAFRRIDPNDIRIALEEIRVRL